MRKKTVFLVISCAIFLIVIQGLFCIPAPTRFLRANWGAGDVLTFVGTALLGWLAIWQNEELKLSNEKSQERLEKMTIEANQLTSEANKLAADANKLSSLGRIVEYELIKKENRESKIREFEDAIDVQNIVRAINNSENVIDIGQIMDIEKRLDRAYLQICVELEMPIKKDNNLEEPLYQASVREMNRCMKKAIKILKSDVTPEDEIIKNHIRDINEQRLNMERLKTLYLKEKSDKLDALIYGEDGILDNIKKVY